VDLDHGSRLGVVLGGLGAISTTLVAGVEAIKKQLSSPIGSLALLGTMEGEPEGAARPTPIREYLGLPSLDRLVFGAWDVVDTDAYEAARRARVLDPGLLEQIRPELSTLRPWPGVFDPRFTRRVSGSYHKSGRTFMDLVDGIRQDLLDFQQKHHTERCVVLWCASTEAYVEEAPAHQSIEAFEAALQASDHTVIAPSMIYAYAALSIGVPFINATPSRTVDLPALIDLALRTSTPIAGKDLKTGQTLIKTILAPGLRDRLLGMRGWYSTNILGNGDGETLDDPDALKTKRESKLSVLRSILRPDVYPDLYGDLHHQVQITFYPPRGDNKESWDSIDIFGWLGYPMQLKINFLCRDSILAAPLLLDLALFADVAKRAQQGGPQEWLGFYFKSPICAPGRAPEHELGRQLAALRRELQRLRGRLSAAAPAPLPVASP
jgi:myo-inositol-1-phosphate synthase